MSNNILGTSQVCSGMMSPLVIVVRVRGIALTPVVGPAVVVRVVCFPRARDRRIRSSLRAISDLFLSQVDLKCLVLAIERRKRKRGDQHLALGEPASRLHYDIANRPVLVVKEQLIHPSHLAIEGMDSPSPHPFYFL